MCPDGRVYNFEVEGNHNYFANGILVHNCHHAVADTYQEVLGYFSNSLLLGVTATPQHPDCELRAAGARFESRRAWFEPFANYTVVDGRLVTGQNQNAGAATAQQMLQAAGGLPST